MTPSVGLAALAFVFGMEFAPARYLSAEGPEMLLRKADGNTKPEWQIKTEVAAWVRHAAKARGATILREHRPWAPPGYNNFVFGAPGERRFRYPTRTARAGRLSARGPAARGGPLSFRPCRTFAPRIQASLSPPAEHEVQ